MLDRFVARRSAVAGLVVLASLAALALVAPLVSPYDPEKPDLLLIHAAPSAAHLLGTDALGRDLASRILHGGRVSLAIGILTAAVAAAIGTAVGAVAGLRGGFVDGLLMRLADVLYAFPRLFVLIMSGVLLRGMTPVSVVLVLGALSWMTTARLVRSTFLSLRRREFVAAARATGARDGRIVVRHLLPNAAGTIATAATLAVAWAIVAESSLSFLGLGVQPPTPTWGNLLKDAASEMAVAPWTAIFPGLAIFLAVASVNLIGDGIRDAFDPHDGR